MASDPHFAKELSRFTPAIPGDERSLHVATRLRCQPECRKIRSGSERGATTSYSRGGTSSGLSFTSPLPDVSSFGLEKMQPLITAVAGQAPSNPRAGLGRSQERRRTPFTMIPDKAIDLITTIVSVAGIGHIFQKSETGRP